jgi:predicted dehydrogenase
MKSITRRSFLKLSIPAGAALAMPRLSRTAEPSDTVRIGILGLGGLNVPGSVGGRGRQLIDVLHKIPAARIVALCDADSAILEHSVKDFKDRGETVAAYRDVRKLLDDKSVDVVVSATPNHWHGLALVWACQAGKDVYGEKPFSHDLWEGRQMVAAVQKYKRIVQVGMQSRSSAVLRQAFADLRKGELGGIRYAHALVYRPREGLASVTAPTAPPPTLDYDLWCGPTTPGPIQRPHLHYEWHWFWDTGNGEMGNNGVHVIDLCRWALDNKELPTRVISLGGRFAEHDTAETPNTQIAFFDLKPAPLICEVRNVKAPNSTRGIGKFRNADKGIVIDCDGGYLAGDGAAAALFDKTGKKIRDIDTKANDLEVTHLTQFLAAVRSRDASNLAASAVQGHLSAGFCHMANLSYRLGKKAELGAIAEAARVDKGLNESFERCREYLTDNGVDLGATPAVLGPALSMDPQKQAFVGHLAAEANQLCRRQYRAPFVIPKLA